MVVYWLYSGLDFNGIELVSVFEMCVMIVFVVYVVCMFDMEVVILDLIEVVSLIYDDCMMYGEVYVWGMLS